MANGVNAVLFSIFGPPVLFSLFLGLLSRVFFVQYVAAYGMNRTREYRLCTRISYKMPLLKDGTSEPCIMHGSGYIPPTCLQAQRHDWRWNFFWNTASSAAVHYLNAFFRARSVPLESEWRRQFFKKYSGGICEADNNHLWHRFPRNCIIMTRGVRGHAQQNTKPAVKKGSARLPKVMKKPGYHRQ